MEWSIVIWLGEHIAIKCIIRVGNGRPESGLHFIRNQNRRTNHNPLNFDRNGDFDGIPRTDLFVKSQTGDIDEPLLRSVNYLLPILLCEIYHHGLEVSGRMFDK